MDYSFSAEDKEKRGFLVLGVTGHPEGIVVKSGVQIGPKAKKQITGLPHSAQIALFSDLRLELSRKYIGWRAISPVSDLYEVELEVSTEGLTKLELYKSLRQIRHGLISIRQILSVHLSSGDKDDGDTSIKVPPITGSPPENGKVTSPPKVTS